MASPDAQDPMFPDQAMRTGFWTGETLRARVGELIAIPGGDAEATAKKVEYASIRLSIGEEVYVTPTQVDPKQRTKRRLKQREGFEIPPGQLAFITTEEVVTVPHDALAFISMRSKQTKFAGLINVSGFHVDPGYSGNIVFCVFNAGPAPIHAARGEEWFVIFLADLDRVNSDDIRRKTDDYRGIPSTLITPVSSEFLTFKGLVAKIDDTKGKLEDRLRAVERDNTVIRWGAALILSFLLAFTVRTCAATDQPLRDPVENSRDG